MFKFKKSKEPEKEEPFKQPKIKHSREIKTHLKERTIVEKIFYLFTNPSKRRTVFKMILAMPVGDLNRNIYMISDQVLNTLIQDKNIEKNLYSVLTRIFKCEKAACLNSLCTKYLKAQLSFDPKYLTFLEFLIRHFKNAIIEEKQQIALYIEDASVKKRLLSIEESKKIAPQNAADTFYYLR